MRGGTLRQYCTIRNLVETPSTATGELVQSWSTVSTAVWADIQPVSGREYWLAQQFESRVDTRITIRYMSGISVKGKVVQGTTEYDVLSIVNVGERDRTLELMCYKVTT